MLRPFASAFLAGEPSAEDFLPGTFRHAGARVEKVRQLPARGAAPGLLEVLRAQAAARPSSAAVHANLDALGQEGTLAVVTGQQVGLFLGPLYSFYKAASAIAAARELTRETGRVCVPVFWLQTEDHDFEEVRSCQVQGPAGEPSVLSLADASEVRGSVRHVKLGPSVQPLLEALRLQLGGLPFAEDFLALLQRHYRPEASLAEAFGGVMASLFAAEGLILIDPRDPALAPLVAPFHQRILREAAPLSKLLLERAALLEASGFGVQAHVRPGSPLFFYHPDGPEGPRYRLDPAGPGWSLVGTKLEVSTPHLERCLREEPGKFSTSALLRPVLQDHLLPVAAYVGGPGEINYLAQVAPLSDALGVPLSMVIPRARFRLVEPRTRSLLEKLKLRPADAERPREDLLEVAASELQVQTTSPEDVEQRLKGSVRTALDALEAEAAALHLADALGRTRATIDRAVSRFVGRYRRTRNELDRIRADRVDRLRGSLFPNEAPQERILALPSFACRYGVDSLKARVFSQLRPFAGSVEDIFL